MAAILNLMKKAFFPHCGGVLVASKYVISASHCFYPRNPRRQIYFEKDMKVRLGEHNTHGSLDPPETDFEIAKIILHPKWDGRFEYSNDIAVIKLASEVNMNLFTPACIATTAEERSFYDKTAQVFSILKS